MCPYVLITFLNLKMWKTFLSMVQNPEAMQEEGHLTQK